MVVIHHIVDGKFGAIINNIDMNNVVYFWVLICAYNVSCAPFHLFFPVCYLDILYLSICYLRILYLSSSSLILSSAVSHLSCMIYYYLFQLKMFHVLFLSSVQIIHLVIYLLKDIDHTYFETPSDNPTICGT